MPPDTVSSSFAGYARKLIACLDSQDWTGVERLEAELIRAWKDGRHVYICGNGGSAANAIHWANDLLYVIAKKGGKGIRIFALPANTAVLTCLGNDEGYDEIFSSQLKVFGKEGDLLIALSGSGNSPNIVRVLQEARELGMKTCALLGFSGGACKDLAEIVVHFKNNDMQVVEDMQLAVCHMLAQSLQKQQPHGP